MVARNGFIVRNAAEVGANLDLAEPDALDFSLLGNIRYGVLRGCNISITGWNVTVTSGVVINNGSVLTTGGQTTLSTPGQSSRFDLIGVDGSGVIQKYVGTPSANPVFPDFPENFVVLASVMVRPGITPPASTDLTDKRVILPERFVTALDNGTLLGSYDPNSLAPKFTIDHDGKTTWGNTTGANVRMSHIGGGVLNIEASIVQATSYIAWDTITANGDIHAGGLINGDNFTYGYGAPVDIGQPGWIYQNLRDGGIWTWSKNIGWQQLSVVPIPAGFIMPSLLPGEPAGWLFLNGQQVDQMRAGGLWDAFPSWQISTGGGPRLQLPNYTGMFMRQGVPGQTGGAATLTLTTDNLPAHKHMGTEAQQMQPAGAHSHTATTGIVAAHDHATITGTLGEHSHTISDPGHKHNGADGGSGGAFIAAIWGGRRRIDGPFNDASHPVAVQEVASTVRAFTGIDRTGHGGGHYHWTDLRGQHSHSVWIDPTTANHTHILNEQLVGANKPIDMMPPFAAVNYLIKI